MRGKGLEGGSGVGGGRVWREGGSKVWKERLGYEREGGNWV